MKSKLTIGLFIDTFFPMIDGVTSVVDNYAKRLTEYADVLVFAPDYPAQTFDDSIFSYRVVRSRALPLPFLDYALPAPMLDATFTKTLKESHLDLVHIHSPFTIGKAGIRYAKKHHIPVVGTMHSQLKQDFLRAAKSPFLASRMTNMVIRQYNQCDECWAVNGEVARVYHEDYRYKTMPRVMNNATDMRPSKDKALYAHIDKTYNIAPDEKVFLYVGRINKLKNILFLADSLKLLKEGGAPPFKMLFVGSGQDEEDLKALIRKNHMEEELLLCGRITDRALLAALYARADLFLFPSLYDASSIVQIEAASQRTPGIFLEGAVTASTVKDRENGFISKRDEKSYADTIRTALENRELYEAVCQNAYRDLYVHWDDAIKEVYAAYQRLVEGNHNHR